ncbi:MAG: hypothetical protein IT252_04305 [Chitinophagaceae bacterium]|nr:hypothetical protein [Chitinophagaceae bacterium]
MLKIKVLAPRLLNLDYLFTLKQGSKKYCQIPNYSIALFCHILSYKSAENYHEGRGNSFCKLHSSILDQHIRFYRKTIEFLQNEARVLLVNRIYSPGHFPRSYRFNNELLENGLEYVSIEVSIREWRRFERFKSHSAIFRQNLTSNRLSLVDFLNSGRITIDTSAASNAIDALMKDRHPMSRDHQSRIIRDIDQNNMNELISFDEAGWRMHSPFTMLKKEIRKHLRVDGEPLVELDVKTSQPFLSLILFQKEYWMQTGRFEKKYKSLEIGTLIPTLGKHIQDTIQGFIPYMFPIRSDGITNIDSGLIEYAEALTNNRVDIYSRLANLSNTLRKEKGYKHNEVSRNSAKKALMKYLFGPNNAKRVRNSTLNQVFATRFGLVDSLFTLLKSYKTGTYKTKYSNKREAFSIDKGYCLFAHYLQRIESTILLDYICPAILKKDSYTPLIPIHDCLLTTVKYSQLVQDTMQDVLSNIVGFPAVVVKKEF